MSFTIATTVEEAVAGLAAGARPIAGGTDLVVGARQGKLSLPEDMVAIDRIASLATIDSEPGATRIGAGVTHARLMVDDKVVTEFTALADAAALVGSPATRNVGTLGGNVMNGSPAMDTGAPLVVLEARAEFSSQDGTRLVELDELWTGPGRTSAGDHELCTALLLPDRAPSSGSAYVRLEYRRAMEIAVVGAASSVTFDGDSVSHIRIALTAVAPTIVEVTGLDDLVGRPLDDAVLSEAAERAADRAQPISDLRASDRYRRHMIGVMARRSLDAARRRARGESLAVPVNRALGIGAAE